MTDQVEKKPSFKESLKTSHDTLLDQLQEYGPVTFRHVKLSWPRRLKDDPVRLPNRSQNRTVRPITPPMQQGVATIAALEVGDVVICGLARCSPKDQWNRMQGRALAMARVGARALVENGNEEAGDEHAIRATMVISKESMESLGWVHVVLDTVFMRWDKDEAKKIKGQNDARGS